MAKTSEYSGFYNLSPEERRNWVADFASLSPAEAAAIASGGLPIEAADHMIENVVGTFALPLGVAVNFLVNDRDVIVPMALEEPSVVAACSNIARIARKGGGFRTSSTDPVMIGQVQLVGVPDPFGAKTRILARKRDILDLANAQDPVLVKFGGGARGVEARVLDTRGGPMVIVHLLVDCRDAMGANAVNTMNEALAPLLEEISGGRAHLKSLANLAVHRLARAFVRIPPDALARKDFPGDAVVAGIVSAYHFADADPFRCATHNKGIMNGIDAVVIATGNDFRAVEAGAHSYAAMGGYHSLTTWEKDAEGHLAGTIELPMAVGLVGGAVKTHAAARANVKMMGVKTASELGEIMAAVGLAQNLGALYALATEGIQRGHMKLHARNVAIAAGAPPELVDEVAARMVAEGKVRADRAQTIIEELRKR
ncbi:MAG: hydroxymethylglutaryl-CoA reductase, degradative [Planctomycetes bacterium]|nr:hydroxymethylglutaryl-CoA reductase, degradative [Planctomycetota bacterium]